MKHIQKILGEIGRALEYADVENSEALSKKLKQEKKQNDEI